MAQILITYCNASSGREVEITYTQETQQIIGVSGDTCPAGSTPLAVGTVLHQHVLGTTLYTVKVKNSIPWATVTGSQIDSCEVFITGVDVTNSTNQFTSDGIIQVTAQGNGPLSFSKDNGVTYQAGNVFGGLAPGNYFIRVRNLHPTQGECSVQDFVIVGMNGLAICDLVIGNISKTLAPNATLEVLDFATTLQIPVEYECHTLGQPAGAFQDSPIFTGLAAGTHVVSVRFKDFTSCISSRNEVIDELLLCDLFLQQVDVTAEQSKDGTDGAITILATTSNGPIQYSIDDGATYQVGNTFLSLAPAIYQVRAKDAVTGCEVFAVVEVKKFRIPVLGSGNSDQGFPIANGPRVVVMSGATVKNSKQNFGNTLFSAMRFKDVSPCEYFQKYKIGDLVHLQYRSSWQINTARVMGYADNLQKAVLGVQKMSNFFNRIETLSAFFTDAGGGQVQVYFPFTGFPTFLKIGFNIVVTSPAGLAGTFEVLDIANGILTATGHIVARIAKVWPGGADPQVGAVQITYDVEDFEIFQTTFDTTVLPVGKYYLLFEGNGSQFGLYSARSEPIETLLDVNGLVELRYKNNDPAFQVDYSTGIEHLLRVEGEIVWGAPGGEREEMEDSRRRLINLRENVTRNPQFNAEGLPPYLGEKLRIAMAHDYFTVDGVEYQKADDLNIEYHHNDGDPFCTVAAKLRQVDFLSENADDQGDVDGEVLELNDGEVMQVTT